jgi:hypothetical protein
MRLCFLQTVKQLGDRLTVGQRTLTPPVLVRIQVPQPPNVLSLQANLTADISAIPKQSDNDTAQKSAHPRSPTPAGIATTPPKREDAHWSRRCGSTCGRCSCDLTCPFCRSSYVVLTGQMLLKQSECWDRRYDSAETTLDIPVDLLRGGRG